MRKWTLYKGIILVQVFLLGLLYIKRQSTTEQIALETKEIAFKCRFSDVSTLIEPPIQTVSLGKLTCHRPYNNILPPISHCGRCSLCGFNPNFSCYYKEIHREGDFKVKLSPVFKITRPVQSDFVMVSCNNPAGNQTWTDLITTTCGNTDVDFDRGEREQNNLLIFGLDSVSRFKWSQLVSKSYNYALSRMGAIEMRGYSIIGDGTTAAFLGILTGKFEQELYDSRKGYKGAKQVDDYPWIWKQVQSLGYVTHWAADFQSYGPFHYRIRGFRRPPVVHYMRPLYLYIENIKMPGNNDYDCFLGKTRLNIMLSSYKRLTTDYPNDSVFSTMFHARYSHDGDKFIPWADDELLEFLKELDLSKTSLILMSDHGRRFGKGRTTPLGRIDERSPLLMIRLSDQLIERHPDWVLNLKANSEALTTPFDLHATLLDIMTGNSDSKRPSAQSLVRHVVSQHRSCFDAEIPAHWCACKGYKRLLNTSKISKLSGKAMDYLNQLMAGYPCSKRLLKKTWRAESVFLPNATMSFVKSADKDGHIPLLRNYSRPEPAFFELTFETSPDGAMFEMSMDEKNVLGWSRLNAYGNTSECVAESNPSIAPICYCHYQETTGGRHHIVFQKK